MPLPYPEALSSAASTCDGSLLAFGNGVNLTVASLDWLHLNRPATCPSEIVAPKQLSRLQWKVVHQIELTMSAWREVEPVTTSAMGRAAGKVDSMDAMLQRLSTFETGLAEAFDEISLERSGFSNFSFTRKVFARGLQRKSAGTICGELKSSAVVVAKPLISSCLEFKEKPRFDPSPFLDLLSWRIFNDPLEEACSPHESFCDPPPVRTHGTSDEVWKLFQKA